MSQAKSCPAGAGHRRSADATARLGGLDDVAAVLWPGSEPFGRRSGKPAAGFADMLIVPSTANPRLVVPAKHPRAAANAVRRHGEASSVGARLQRGGLAWALRAGLGRLAFPSGRRVNESSAPAVADHLSEVLNQPIVISFALTPRRANRKPVLHLLDLRGRTVAFAKIGINPLTHQLVRREGANLVDLARAELTIVRVPEVIYRGTWNDLEILVLSPLPTWQGKALTPGTLRAGMQEVAAAPLDQADVCASAGYARRLVERANEIEPRTSGKDRAALAGLREVAEELDSDPVTTGLELGTWHGDWTPWNCRQLGSELLVWDWERCAPRVPLGFDALHFALQRRLFGERVPHRQAAESCLARAPEDLQSWVPDREAAGTVAALYLMEIGLRYIADAQRIEGGWGGDVSTWILPALRSRISLSHPGRGSTT